MSHETAARPTRRTLCAATLSWGLLGSAAVAAATAKGQPADRPLKIVHVMSYHSPWRWTDGQLQGFKDALAVPSAEVRVFQMDAKKFSTPEQKAAKGEEARALIDRWQPDLLYTSDDEAQELVASRYVNQSLPIVFSGVNKAPQTYGFEGSSNVAGVLEHEHSVESVKLLQALAPGARRFVAVFDEAALWPSVQARMKERLAGMPGVEFVAWDTIRTFDDYKRKLQHYQTSADAMALIGVFNFKDDQGRNVPYQQVMRWTAEHSKLPDFGFWVDRVHHGSLAAVTVSEREQGLAAGRIARGILVEGRAPSSFKMEPTRKGAPVISLARAQKLGLTVKTGLLLSAEVVPKFEWDQ
ncbi:ABC transporter substrate-binding protein [Ideonella sp. A 288]|uniref:ABC transporter substrate-binding protein n=1 Tax=Ideonella sp. A 288 TaxID=1962181 RepID=UPI0018FE5120|nr:ABC transporter substrate binding protein [Ideonella sp. A 288]